MLTKCSFCCRVQNIRSQPLFDHSLWNFDDLWEISWSFTWWSNITATAHLAVPNSDCTRRCFSQYRADSGLRKIDKIQTTLRSNISSLNRGLVKQSRESFIYDTNKRFTTLLSLTHGSISKYFANVIGYGFRFSRSFRSCSRVPLRDGGHFSAQADISGLKFESAILIWLISEVLNPRARYDLRQTELVRQICVFLPKSEKSPKNPKPQKNAQKS